ncbi:MAG: hypothetical protein WA399_17595, partial [Acidobacteriaceae bacterium]
MFLRVPFRSAAVAAFFVLTTFTSAQTSVPDGIPRALAQSRAARVFDLHYELHFTLIPHAPSAAA